MSFIEEQRNNTLENNTAQSELLDFLEHLNPQVSDIIIREPLSGDLDFSVLKECNLAFSNITSIQFVKGNITSLKHIPDGITKIVCIDNLLVDIVLPASIVEANLSGNALKSIDFKELTNLKELHIDGNQFSTLYDLPKCLEVLYCENNRLKSINLDGIDNLKVLHCSNNPSLTIEHFPDTITDLHMENNPLLHVNRPRDDDNTSEDDGDNHADFMESLNTYFEMKTSYEEKVHAMKKKVFKHSTSKKVTKKLIAELKPKCINCNRPVGSIFSNKERTYSARCGDVKQPCDLNIQIFAGEFGLLDKLLSSFQQEIQDKKEAIIKQKLDTLFNYIGEQESIAIFKKDLEEYTEVNTFLKELTNEYTDIYFNEKRKENIEKKMEHIDRIRERFNDLLVKYSQTDNPELLKDAMTVYVSEIKPEIDNLQMMKYETMEINKEGDKYVMFQKEYRLSKLDFTFGSYPKVLKFRSKK